MQSSLCYNDLLHCLLDIKSYIESELKQAVENSSKLQIQLAEVCSQYADCPELTEVVHPEAGRLCISCIQALNGTMLNIYMQECLCFS